jgi:DNA-binding PadR family transcriptional regulator
MSSTRSTTTYALLGLLATRSWTTYELAKQVHRSLSWFWPRAERKLYDEPKRLVADGLATAMKESTGKRPRTVYGITDTGRAELRRWLSEPPAARSSEFEAMVKVFFADAGDLSQLASTLHLIEQEATARIDALAAMAAVGADAPQFPQRLHISALCLRLQLEQEATVLRWVSWARASVDEWHDAGDPGSWDFKAVLTELAADARAVTARAEAATA